MKKNERFDVTIDCYDVNGVKYYYDKHYAKKYILIGYRIKDGVATITLCLR